MHRRPTRPARGAVVAALALAAAGVVAAGCGDGATATASTPIPTGTAQTATEAARAPGLRLRRVVGGLGDALFVTPAPGQGSRLYVVQQSGRILVLENGRLRRAPFLDLSSRISSGGEQGLLGLAFDPGFATNRRFYVNYTDPAGTTRIARYTAAGSAARTAATGRVILSQPQPYSNHNGGMLAFGPDRMLYIGLGDGGSGGDPENRAQDLGTMLGKILRIDPNPPGGGAYAVPADNPFTGTAGARGEIWAYGLRNPWRFAFDRANGDLWIADVGQNAVEEVNRAPAGASGLNFGWNAFEGRSRFGGTLRPGSRAVAPVAQYTHSAGVSVTGGYVYRGRAVPALRGRYVFADYASGRVWSMRAGPRPGGLRQETGRLGVRLQSVTSFGQDTAGEVYVIANQSLYRFTR